MSGIIKKGSLVQFTGKGLRSLYITGFDEDYVAGRKYKPGTDDTLLILEPPTRWIERSNIRTEFYIKVLWGTKIKTFIISYVSGEDDTDYFRIIK